jgi:murein DD-endopeptidase MepM/ murein hydrolase activator NlpD
MNQPYFIVVLAHSLHGRIRRFQIDQKIIFAVLGLALLGCFTLFGMVSSYLRMAWKVSQYNRLQAQTDALRARYQSLLKESSQKSSQVAQLQLLASEVSMAYGIRQISGSRNVPAQTAQFSEATLAGPIQPPSFNESLQEYNLLKSANLNVFGNSYIRRYLVNSKPSLWPVIGRILSPFGKREDPFNGMQATHTGVDISAAPGTPVRVTADGIVVSAEYSGGGYGKLVVVDHGGGLQTFYAHLSRIDVLPGQEVRMGQFIAASGATGRVTTPHLHYEVRIGGNPINPYSFLDHSFASPVTQREFGF